MAVWQGQLQESLQWENAPLEFQFLYTLIICMDANFCLKNQIVSSFSRDPGLGIGWAYFVPKPTYDAYVLNHMSDKDISTCIGFVALAKADTKFSWGLCFTGVGTVSCAWDEFIMSVGNLQKGERYASMDFIFASTLQNFVMLLLGVISYDIACQWFVNLYKCMNGWPSNLRINRPLKLRPVISKFHEPTHKVKKHHEFSYNLVKGLGNCDCEGPERIWGGHNNLGNSMKTMGPGSCHNMLDDHFGFWNWQKYIRMGKSLICKYKVAIKEHNVQVEEHRGLSANLLAHLVAQWDSLCEVWEDDMFPKTAENPFHVDEEFLSEKEVEKELEEEEEEHKHNGGVIRHAMSADKFLVLGLKLEESQWKVQSVAVKCTNKMLTKHQDTSLADQRNVLHTKLKA
ncbi:uncharacterized protein ARMOST_03163 [Armillaria ostoyae]|uniref:CxC2-like cysteine cluster KDZ transposase-associated domain-containing protein n=1 Tax=Armillaria ostoyae TaxID=47428 RepID=A0A284QTP8_ARMOS|nr:uncharacterized protein ARMOST_03163 [Armillaria ostoyae]